MTDTLHATADLEQAPPIGDVIEALMTGAIDPESLDPEHRAEVIRRLSGQAMMLANENSILRRSVQELQRSAYIEPMTELLNRRGFEEKFNEWREHNMDNPNVRIGIIYLDMDNLKKDFNDKFSHEVGDKAIKYLAEALRNVTREDDIVARFGGDEFVMAIPGDKRVKPDGVDDPIGNSTFDVKVYIEELPNRVKAWLQSSVEINSDNEGAIYKLNEALSNMQFSYGGIVYGQEALTMQLKDLLHGADSLMYEQKKRKQELRKDDSTEYHI